MTNSGKGTDTYTTARRLALVVLGCLTLLGMSGCNENLPEAIAGERWAASKAAASTQEESAEPAEKIDAESTSPFDTIEAEETDEDRGLLRSMSAGSGGFADTEIREVAPARDESAQAPRDRRHYEQEHHALTLEAMLRVDLSDREKKLIDAMGWQVEMVNSTAELYRVKNNGNTPPLANRGWTCLDVPRYRTRPPQNLFMSGPRYASKIAPSIEEIGPKTGWVLDRPCDILAVVEHGMAVRLGLIPEDASPGDRTDYVITY